MYPSRWLAVGQSDGSESEAGTLAADRALVRTDAKLLVVFCSESHNVAGILGQINNRSGGVPVIGCSTSGEIATSGPHDTSVVVTAFGGDGFSIDTAVAQRASSDLRAAGTRAARCLTRVEDRPHRVLLLLSDAHAGDQQEVLRGAYAVLGAGVPLVGGCAGDTLTMTPAFQMHGDQVLTDSVVAAGISSDAPFGIGARHGWRRIGEPMLVTGSGGNRLYTLDGEPALDVYLERLGAAAPAHADEEEFARVAQVHPLGLARRDGEEQIRLVAGADYTDRSLTCIAEVPQAGLVWLMEGDADSVLDATDAACDDSLLALEGQPPLGLLAFDCTARRTVLGDQGIRAEVDRIAKRATGAPVAGFYTCAEIARTRGPSGVHNQTLVVLSVA
jgi:hypothetical protein